MMRLVKGKKKEGDIDRKSVSSFGSRSSLAMSGQQPHNQGKDFVGDDFQFPYLFQNLHLPLYLYQKLQ